LALYETYDAGAGGRAASSSSATPALPPFCSLDEYLKMLIFETPVPVRRLALDVRVLLPGPAPVPGLAGTPAATGGRARGASGASARAVTMSLPPPDALPLLQFRARAPLSALAPRALLRLLAAVALNRPVVVVARTPQRLTEIAEAALALVYPLQYECGYVPVLPASMGDVLQSPSPVLCGLLLE
jgi:hypothetical protein